MGKNGKIGYFHHYDRTRIGLQCKKVRIMGGFRLDLRLPRDVQKGGIPDDFHRRYKRGTDSNRKTRNWMISVATCDFSGTCEKLEFQLISVVTTKRRISRKPRTKLVFGFAPAFRRRPQIKTPSARLLLRLKQNEIARYERRQRPRLNHRTP